MNIYVNAARRYAAMTDDLLEMSSAESAQAIDDRKLFGEYIPKPGCVFEKPALLLRFMSEVCNISLRRARDCVAVVIDQYGAHRMEPRLATDVAAAIMEDCGNVLVADAVVDLYMLASEGTASERFWEDVAELLRGEPFDDEAALG